MKRRQGQIVHRWGRSAVTAVVALIVLCGGAVRSTGVETAGRFTCGESPGILAALAFQPQFIRAESVDFQIKTGALNVWMGPAGSAPPRLPPGDWKALPRGSQITTDAQGEAWLTSLENRRQCGRMYIFQSSGLKLSTCGRAQAQAGNVLCARSGASYFIKSCVGLFVLETPGARVVLRGTTVALLYLPGRQLSLVVLFEGQAQAQAIGNFETGASGPTSVLTPGSFWFSLPAGSPSNVAGLNSQSVYPLDRLPRLIGALQEREANLTAWIGKILSRAREDNVPFPAALEVYLPPSGSPSASGPTITSVRVVPPSPSTTDQVILSATARELGARLGQMEIYVNGALVQHCGTGECRVTLAPQPIGRVSYEVRAYNEAGQATSQVGTFAVTGERQTDVDAPVFTRLEVIPAQLTPRESFTLTAEARDLGGTVSRIELDINGRTARVCYGDTCSVTVGPFQFGSVRYSARAYDKAGNEVSRAGSVQVSECYAENSVSC